MRAILAIVAGVIAALLTQSLVDLAANQFYPAAITDMWDRRQLSEAFAARPTGALLLNVAGFFLGGLAGAALAKRLAGAGWILWVPPGLLALMALLVAFSFPLPAWTWFATFAAPLIGGLIANHLVGDRPEAGTAAPDGIGDA